MPTNDKEYQRKYMKRYRAMMKEAKELRRQRLGYDESEENKACRFFREQVIAWLDGKIRKTHKMVIAWDAHMCNCHACAEWYVSVKRSGFKYGVNLFQKKE